MPPGPARDLWGIDGHFRHGLLVAAVFWTWLWGPIGLLLSTLLTVCVVVVGRYVPLEFVGILFGDEPVLSPAQRFYQRMIALDADEAAEHTEQLLRDQTLAEVYDGAVKPALSLAEEGRHAGLLDATVEEYFLENTRELVEYVGSQHYDQGRHAVFTRLICLPAKVLHLRHTRFIALREDKQPWDVRKE